VLEHLPSKCEAKFNRQYLKKKKKKNQKHRKTKAKAKINKWDDIDLKVLYLAKVTIIKIKG
jgi:hypothetical protein